MDKSPPNPKQTPRPGNRISIDGWKRLNYVPGIERSNRAREVQSAVESIDKAFNPSDTSSPQIGAAYEKAPKSSVAISPRATSLASPEVHVPDRASSGRDVHLTTNTPRRAGGEGVHGTKPAPGESFRKGQMCNFEPNPDLNRQTQITTKRHVRLWNNLLPWIQIHLNEIVGVGNTGAILFLPSSKDPRPVIQIISSNPEKANCSVLETKLSDDDAFSGLFVVEVSAGTVSQSMNAHALLDPYQERPTCGASIGVAQFPDSGQTFGGYVYLEREHEGCQGKVYGLTCHHMLQDFSTAESNDGVRNGILGDREVRLLQPSLGHARFVQKLKSPSLPDSGRALNRQLKDYEARVGSFGKVICSSGYRLEEYDCSSNKCRQIDWALITDIPDDRFGSNLVQLPSGDRVPVDVMTLSDFSKYVLGDIDQENEDLPIFPTEEQCKFVYGVGAFSGLEEGAELEKILVPVQWESDGPCSIESVFTPQKTLGVSGDSGTLIFDADGDTAVGIIIGCIEQKTTTGTQLRTIYTPMHAVFDDITKVMTAKNIRLATKLDLPTTHNTFNSVADPKAIYSALSSPPHMWNVEFKN